MSTPEEHQETSSSESTSDEIFISDTLTRSRWEIARMQLTNCAIVIDRIKTGEKLRELRLNNENFGRYICEFSRKYRLHFPSLSKEARHCDFHCSDCKEYNMAEEQDSEGNIHKVNDISLGILSSEEPELTTWSKSSLDNTEKGNESNLSLDRAMAYAYIAQVPLHEIIVFQDDNYYFDENGIIRQNPKVQQKILDKIKDQ